jgi:uncharacterized protein YdaU (DUF1376 family)
MNFYKHYIGDFQRDTTHLSLTARGAYLTLMHHYYATEEPLPSDHVSCCRIAGAFSKAERDGVKEAMSFFERKDGKLWHKRIEAELEKSEKRSDKNRDIALAREARKRAEKDAQTSHEESTNRGQKRGTERAQTEHETCTTNSTIPEAIAIASGNTQPHPQRASPAASIEVFPITADWQPSAQFATLAKLSGLPPVPNAEGLGEFKAYWLTQPNTNRTQLEWDNALVKSLKHEHVRAASTPRPAARRAGAHTGFDTKDYTAGVNEDGTLA